MAEAIGAVLAIGLFSLMSVTALAIDKHKKGI